MNRPSSLKPNVSQSILYKLKYLFIAERDPAYFYWILAGVTLVGLMFRLWRINDPIAYDEAYTFIYFATRPFRQFLSDYSAPNNHILHTILVSLSYKLLGGHTWIVRLPALLAGTLCIPAAYLAGRRILNANQSLAAAALVALTPWFISYSANGRGYTLLCLLALLLANFAGLLVRQQSRTVLLAYGITAALGFYTIPVFLYPMAGVSLWVLFTYLMTAEPWKEKSRKVWAFLGICAEAGILTLILYSPVIFFGTGAGSIVSNEYVAARDWTFVENIPSRLDKTWSSWMQEIAPTVQYLLLAGFLISLLFYRKASRQRLPLQAFLILAIIILLPIQRVAPLPRVWFYLEAFYMLFAAAGLVWLLETLLKPVPMAREKLVSAAIGFLVLGIFVARFATAGQTSAANDPDDSPEQFAAAYLKSHLRAEDTVLSIAPVDIQTAYYLYINGVPYQVFYQKDHPVDIQNAVIVLRKNSKYNTPEKVLDFYQLTPQFDLATSELVYEYGPVNIFSVPAK